LINTEVAGMTDMKAIEAKAMSLPPELRAILAQHLLASLDDLDERENERIWLAEAEQRYQGYQSGSIPSSDAFDAVADMRARLK
jgi:hypothetical protein